MRRFGFIITGIIVMFVGGYMLYKNLFATDTVNSSIWWAIIIPFGLLVAGFIPLLYGATADNIYNIESGTVVGQDFTPRHYVQGMTTFMSTTVNGVTSMYPIYHPGYWVEDDWALQLQDERGRTGWIHFETNVLPNYPKGTYYP